MVISSAYSISAPIGSPLAMRVIFIPKGLSSLAIYIAVVVLLVYYVMRIVTLYIGAVLSPLVSMLWLVPGFRDFAETAFKTYLTTIFVLFTHVIILQLSSSILTGLATASGDNAVYQLVEILLFL